MQFRFTFFSEFCGEGTSPNERAGLDNAQTTRVFQVHAGPGPATGQVRAQALEDLLGFSLMVTGDPLGRGHNVSYVTRQVPHSLPAFTTAGRFAKGAPPVTPPFLFAAAVASSELVGVQSNQPLADGTGIAQARLWRIRIVYDSLPYDVKEDDQVLAQAPPTVHRYGVDWPASATSPLLGLPDEGDCLRRGWTQTRWVSKFLRPGGRMVSVPPGFLRFETDNVPLWYTIGIQQPFVDVEYVWHQVPVAAYPAVAIETCLGSVNTDIFDGMFIGTWMVLNVGVSPRRGPLGDRLLDVTVAGRYLPNMQKVAAGGNPQPVPLGHNSTLRVKNAGAAGASIDYESVTAGPGLPEGGRPIRYTDVTSLFRPDQPS